MEGKQLKEYLTEVKKVKLSTLADDLGMSRQALHSLLSAESVKLEFLQQIATVLHIDVQELVNLDPVGIVSEPGTDYKTKYMQVLEENSQLKQQVIDLQALVIKDKAAPKGKNARK